ncbi:MAG: PQQ-binding-like beta-propeller repeat protein [Planctomycetes bacterium]|nr:PQQ-binding-like beta-propeller repeat protein [Planctomycetota bacterium]
MRILRTAAVSGLALVLLAAMLRADKDDSVTRDERTLREAGIDTDGPGLLAFLRKNTTTDADVASLEALIKDLGADRFRVREQATARLIAVGERAVSLLRVAEKSRDPEVAYRARRCLEQIKQGASEALLATAARLLALRKPDGAAKVLLDYVPFAEQEYLVEEVRTALAAVAVRDGKPDPVVVEALTDRHPARRAAAGVALARAGVARKVAGLHKLLQDSKPRVRLVVGLALARARDKDALPVLIALLEELPAAEIGEAENLLFTLAADKAPEVSAGTTPEERKKYRAAWDDWYRAHKDGLDLAKLGDAARLAGHTLVLLLDEGRAVDVDRDNKPRWQVEGLKFPLDAQYLPGDHLLVAEYQGGRVSERNRKGEVVWEKRVLQPLVAQRLPNGNTFIATSNQLSEVDKSGKEVWSQTPPLGGRVMKAVRLRNGHVACVTEVGGSRFYEIDRDGNVIRNFPVQLSTSGGRIDVLPNGHVVVPEKDNNRVIEHNVQGRRIWEAPFEQPIAAVRLGNGHTLVTSYQSKKAVELDRNGKPVWEYESTTRLTRAWRH